MESERTRALEVLAAFAAPWRPRFGRTRRVGAIAVVCAATEIAGLIAASWRWTRYLLGP